METLDDIGYPFLLVEFELEQLRGQETKKKRIVGWAKRKRHETRPTVLTRNEREMLLDRPEIDIEWLEGVTAGVRDGEAEGDSGSGRSNI